MTTAILAALVCIIGGLYFSDHAEGRIAVTVGLAIMCLIPLLQL